MGGNYYSKRWASWSFLGKWTRAWMAGWSWLWCSCAVVYGELPPSPPGFTLSPAAASATLQSPKAAGAQTTLMVKAPSGLMANAVAIPTNHAPPIVSIEWHQVAGGPYGTPTPDMTNEVPRSVTCLATGLAIQHMGVGGKTYEVQVNFGFPDTNWWSYARWVMPKDDVVTTYHPVYLQEKERFFRVRSN